MTAGPLNLELKARQIEEVEDRGSERMDKLTLDHEFILEWHWSTHNA